jgi:hypothetical protein
MDVSSGLEELFVRVYLDRHIKPQLAYDLRRDGFDVLTTQEAAMDTASDEDQFAFATSQHRAVFTFNIRDFAPLHHEWRTSGREHAGIIVSQQLGGREYGILLARMRRLLNKLTAEEMRNNLVHLEQFK